MIRSLETVAVFCGSNHGAGDEFKRGARALGQALAAAGITLVYGGTTNGLMGVLADAALAGGGEVHGVTTNRLHDLGLTHGGLSRLEVAPSVRERKARMCALADGFIALPGGVGTLDEVMEVWSMNQLAEHDKPLGLLNLAQFFSPFLAFIDHMVDSQFLPPSHRSSVAVETHPVLLIDTLRRYVRPDVPKWMGF